MSETSDYFDPVEMKKFGLDAEVEIDRRIWAATEPSGEMPTDYLQDTFAFGAVATQETVERSIIVTRHGH